LLLLTSDLLKAIAQGVDADMKPLPLSRSRHAVQVAIADARIGRNVEVNSRPLLGEG